MKKTLKFVLSIMLSLIVIVSCVQSCFAIDFDTFDIAKRMAKPVALGQVEQKFLSSNIVQWFKFTANEDQYYRVNVLNQSVEARTNLFKTKGTNVVTSIANLFGGYISIDVYDEYAFVMASQSLRCGYDGSIYVKLHAGQTYYISFSSSMSGNYRFSVDKMADIGADTRDDATDVTATALIVSNIDAPGDVDWFVFNTDDYHSFYNFSLENIGCSGSIYCDLYEFVPGATELRSIGRVSASNSYTSEKNFELKNNTKYFYCISSSGNYMGSYLLDVTQQYDEVGSTMNDAYDIPVDTTIVSSYDGDGDIDYYKFDTADYDAYYHISFNNLGGTYYCLYLYDEAENKVLSTSSYSGVTYDNFNGNAKLEKNATYYLYLKGNKRSNYEFSITTVADTVPNNWEDAVVAKTNTLIENDLAADSDKDWYKFDIESTGNYRIRLVSENNERKEITLYNGKLNSQRSLSTYSEDYITYVMSAGETYYIRVSGYSGDYTLVLAECGNGHDYQVDIEIMKPTCTDKGVVRYKCRYCFAEKTETDVPALGHNEEIISSTAPTCTESGLTSGKRCAVCGKVFEEQKEIPAVGHNGEWIAATDKENTEYLICTVCGEILEERSASPEYMLGDVNGDGKITAADARLALRISARLEIADEWAMLTADVDRNGTITAADARKILRVSAHLDSF